ncbi:MAG: hypothetical protein ABSB22_01355 [Thermodesulfobacteriota bacterium]
MILPDSITEKGIFLKDQFFDLRGLSAYSSLSISTLRDHIRVNSLPAYPVHGKILVKKSEFDKWISGYRINKKQDLNALADEVLEEIGYVGQGQASQRIDLKG